MGMISTKTDAETGTVSDFDFSIPEDLLIDLLSYVPSSDLLKNCRLVCRLWKNIIDGHSLWKLKCEQENKFIPPVRFERLPDHFFRQIYIYNPYGFNLLKNSCGESDLREWQLMQNDGDGFCIEDPPKGAEPVPEQVGTTKCFATSYGNCEKFQLIDLLARGVHSEIIDLPNSKIEIGEWYAARFDCASVYKLDVFLLDEKCHPDMFLIDHHHVGVLDLKKYTVDHFGFEHTEEQWVGKEWNKVTHTFKDVKSTRYVIFKHIGKDCQYWAGHYGSKMTGAYVKIIV